MKYQRVISIHGVPRSGTSWLGQIFKQHSDVAYRFQPAFSYRFRGRLHPDSSQKEIRMFLDELYEVRDDDFIAGNWPALEPGVPPQAVSGSPKGEHPPVMVLKEVRYHYLIDKFLQAAPDVSVIGIVRNPCAVINSWLRNPKEFLPGWDPRAEWRKAQSKNRGLPEEYFGFEKWKEVALHFIELESKFPDRFLLVQYERLVLEPLEVVAGAFRFSGLELQPRVAEFIQASQSRHIDDPYAVYKSPRVKDRWRHELDPDISQAILTELQGTPLDRFLE